ncbi:MAG: amino acid permease [Thermoplasmata archaeon]|nr:MAG: amino acid permease [Thermoplasmata archaeon]
MKAEAAAHPHKLRRTLTAIDVTAIGIGSIIGAGIFVLVGVAAATKAGPAIILSFIVAGIACFFVALCYAELASTIPIAGSAYTFSYASMGELIAWMIGWDLILEYSMGGLAVSIGWSGYIVEGFASAGIHLPTYLTAGPFVEGGFVNLPAVFIVLLLTFILVIGTKESARFNLIIVIIKVSVLVFIIIVGMRYFDGGNLSPFFPYGGLGVFLGAGLIFFAFIGFEAICTTAEEVKNPEKNLPLGIMMSLIICTILYILAATVLVGMVPFYELNVPAPYGTAFRMNDAPWAAGLISLGAIAGITSVLLVSLLAQPRVLFAMSRDGLIPKKIAQVHPRFGTPYIATLTVGIVVAFMAAFLPIEVVAELVNIGTLFAFTLVCLAIPVLRKKDPDLHRPFRTPLVPLVPLLGAGFSIILMLSLPPLTWFRFFLWLGLGFIIYANYGYYKSKLKQEVCQ